MPHDHPDTRAFAPKLNLALPDGTVDIEGQIGNRAAIHVSPDPDHSVGFGTAAVVLEWSGDHETWFAVQDDQAADVEFDTSTPALRAIDIGGATYLRLRVKTADGTADPQAAVFFTPYLFAGVQ